MAFASTVARLPQRIHATLTRLDQGLVSVRLPEVEKSIRRLDGSTRRTTSAVIFAALLIGGIALRVSGDDLGNLLLVVSAVPLVHALGLFRFKN